MYTEPVPKPPATSRAFILRITPQSGENGRRIVLKPSDGGAPCVFQDLASAFAYLQRQLNTA